MEKVRIIVCTHMRGETVRENPPYLPVFAGSALHPELDLGYQRDDEGDNISDKNRDYCELTALYWAWKNLRNVEYLGLAHYRRYLGVDINEDNIDALMDGVDMLTLDRPLMTYLVGDAIVSYTSMEDTYLYIDTLLKLHPEYREAVIEYFYNSRELYRCTMFVARRELYDKFCETFFPVFFELENRLKKHQYSRQNRAIAYFGEISLGLFITHERLKVKMYPCDSCEPEKDNSLAAGFRELRWKILRPFKVMLYKLATPRFKEIPTFAAAINAMEKEGIELTFHKRQA